MGYSTCEGRPFNPHKERRACDGCDACPACDGFAAARLYCWRCCGRVDACPRCAPRLARHIAEQGPPRGVWALQPDIVRGYQRALAIVAGGNGHVMRLWQIATAPDAAN